MSTVLMDFFSSIGARLREAREAMGMSQSEFAAIAEKAGAKGATRQSQALYEKGQRMPDAAYLAAIAAAGADVQYILTGVPSGGASNAKALSHLPDGAETVTVSPWEKALIENVRECDKEDRDAVGRLALRSAEAQHKDVTEQTGKRRKAK